MATILVLLASNSESVNQIKFRAISVFNQDQYHQELFDRRQMIGGSWSFWRRWYASQPALISSRLITNFFKLWSSEFLFIKGGDHPTHNFSGLGNLHWFEAPLLILGFYLIISHRRPWQRWLMWWLMAASVAPILTTEPNHSIRFSPALVPLTIISVWGLVNWWEWLGTHQSIHHRWWSWAILGRISTLVIIFTSYTYLIITYFWIFPVKDRDRWPWYMREIVTQVTAAQQRSPKIVMQGQYSSPYIYFLFYRQYDPQLISSNLEYYPTGEDGFQHASRLENIYFQNINWPDMETPKEPILYLLRPQELPGDKKEKPQYRILGAITDSIDNLKYEWWEYDGHR